MNRLRLAAIGEMGMCVAASNLLIKRPLPVLKLGLLTEVSTSPGEGWKRAGKRAVLGGGRVVKGWEGAETSEKASAHLNPGL